MRSSRLAPAIRAAAGVAAAVGVVAGAGAATATPAAPTTSAATTPATTAVLPAAQTIVDGDHFIGAVGGHLVGSRRHGAHGMQFLELSTTAPPRVIATLTRRVSINGVGTDRAGRPVVLATWCPKGTNTGCKIETIDVATGKVRRLGPIHDLGAVAIGEGRLAFERGLDVIVSSGGAGGKSQRLSLDDAVALDPSYTESRGGGISVTSFSVSAAGDVAATLEYDTVGNGGSEVVLHRAGGRWVRLAKSGYGEASGVPRVYKDAQVDATGVRAYYDGGDSDAPFVARWSLTGKLLRTVRTKPFGATAQVLFASVDDDHLVTVPDTQTLDCLNDDQPDVTCGVRRYGPLGLG